MKSFARNRKNRQQDGPGPDTTDALLDVDELDIAPIGIGTPAAAAAPAEDPNAAEAADFAERLGDLDRFIGGGSIGGGSTGGGVGAVSAPSAPISWSSGVARNLPAAPIPSVAPISHPRPAPVDRAPVDGATERPVADPEDEAQEFVDRLGDLDRFIGGTAPLPAPAPAVAPAADPEAEAQDFLDRLGDLDRFIGGHGGQQAPR